MNQNMVEISDDYMNAELRKTKPYTVVLLHATAKKRGPGENRIIWEHGRRNFALRLDGRLCLVCPATDQGGLSGLYIFRTNPQETRAIVEDDPGVKAGLFTFTIHSVLSFPGDKLT